jgi:rhodanese-related sulfurtransferase
MPVPAVPEPPAAPRPPATWPLRCRLLLLNGVAFGLCYPLANLWALRHGVTRSLALPFDSAIPFVPWMIVPYACSGLLFCLSFAWVRSAPAVRLLSRRLLLATLAASLCFVLVPLRFALPRPPVGAPGLAALFHALDLVDHPYNQFPSLHVAYCLIYWSALRRRAGCAHRLLRPMLAGGLLLVAVSTVFTWQHHLPDVAGGVLLGLLTIRLVPARHGPLQAVAWTYLLVALLVLQAGWLVTAGLPAPARLPVCYLAASLLLVSRAYRRRQRHFLHKHHGRHPGWIWLLYAPYLAGYWLTWQLVRLQGRGRPPFRQAAALLWVGRRLTAREARQLPPGCLIIDLANELSETAGLRRQPYRHVALFDLAPPDPAAVGALVDVITAAIERGQPVYLHCAMGYRRSAAVARHYTSHLATGATACLPCIS